MVRFHVASLPPQGFRSPNVHRTWRGRHSACHVLLRCLVLMATPTASRSDAPVKPKLIVFDLDYTLWPFWVDTHVDPPFTLAKDGKVYDSHRRHVTYYPQVPEVLQNLHSQGYQLGIASRTSCRQEANELIHLFKWDRFFHFREIFPGSKTTHFRKLQKSSGFEYEDMIFFDDEHRNVVEVEQLGVLCIFVEDGVTKSLVQNALEQFANKRKMSSKHKEF
ncbi:magnesium-dependent phosphatase 1-like isoform X1 [Pomacea canaliculata]|uniref:magnesium-dependent phosphatase 1-like isoform X1 n=2 Tax=Pomacea canaliculata TaxID=400727 RepID=UPI000D7369C4|nr:magnesium-dependent phosphatase 1-like isoform X1 [Pomacea canaliculata]